MTISNGTQHTKASASPRSWRATFSSLENRNYRWFWLSSLAWFTGLQVQMFARGWLVYDLSNSPLVLGWVSFVFGMPVLLLSSVGGAITDRVEKRGLLVIAQLAAAAINGVIAVFITLGTVEVWHIMIASGLTGIVVAFSNPARQSAVPDLVERSQIMNAVSLSSAAMNVTRIVGPALGGILVGIIDIGGVYYISVFSYVLSALLLLFIPTLGRGTARKGSTVSKDLVQGFRYVRQEPVLLGLLSMAFVPLIFGMGYNFLMPVVAVKVLNVGASGLGFLMAAVGFGALMGSLIMASLGDLKRKGRLLLISSTAFGVFLVLFAASGYFYLSLSMLLVVGVFNTMYTASNLTLLQLHTEDEMRGRVMGMYMITIGLIPISILPISALAEVAGVQVALGAGGAIVALFTVAMAFLRPGLSKL